MQTWIKKKDKINTVKEYGGIERFHFFFFLKPESTGP